MDQMKRFNLNLGRFPPNISCLGDLSRSTGTRELGVIESPTRFVPA